MTPVTTRDLASVAPDFLPMAFADVYSATTVGERVRVSVSGKVDRSRARDAVVGAGFECHRIVAHAGPEPTFVVNAARLRTLPDMVAPGMRLLLCGLNPSLYSADVGSGFARAGNRFWPALAAAGVADVDRDPRALLERHHVGMTDVVKRATVAASELTTDEYRSGMARVERLVDWLRPGAICFVGLAGWRAAVNRKAVPGWQPDPLGSATAAYVMPSTSGLNAAASLASLADHLRVALG